MDNNQRLIQLTEIAALDFPESNGYKYKCRVQATSNEGQPLLHKELFIRTRPSWLLDLKNEGDCTITMTLCYRAGDISQPWQDAGTVTFATQEVLNGQRSTELELPITTWSLAPQLKLKTRLTQSTSAGSSSTLTLLGNQNADRRHVRGTQAEVVVEIPEGVSLHTAGRSHCQRCVEQAASVERIADGTLLSAFFTRGTGAKASVWGSDRQPERLFL